MADKSIDQLNAAEKVYATDLFVLQQSGTAKKLTGQVLENWLLSFANGHGGIHSIEKTGTSGLVDTYRIALADTTTFDFVVTNGRSVNSIAKTSTSGLVDTYTITYNNGTSSTFTVTNGAKGDKGDNAYTWIKYASQEPTEASNSIGDIPDEWRGEYNGPLAEAPTDWKAYKWYKVKGEKGDTGDAATLLSKSVTYQVSDSGKVEPSGEWLDAIPSVPQGKYLWTRTITQFNTGDPVTSFSVAYSGINGTGSVNAVCDKLPDSSGNVDLTAADVGAVPTAGGTMTGNLSIPAPTEAAHAVNKAYADTTAVTLSLPASGWAGDSAPFTQTVTVSGLVDGRRVMVYPAYGDDLNANLAMQEACACISYATRDGQNVTITCLEDKPAVDINVIAEVYV